MRAHYYRPFTDNTGVLLPGVQVSLYVAGTNTLLSSTIYADGSTGTTLNNPFVSSNGIIDFYLDAPMRVDIGVVQGNAPASMILDQDVISTGSDSPHTGTGTNSTAVGQSSLASATNSVSLGYQANATGNQSTALGATALAGGVQSTALGNTSTAGGTGATSLGYNTSASGVNSTVLGNGASSTHVHSTAIGAGAQNTDDNQIMLGTVNDYVEYPNYFVLKSPNGTRWTITIDNNGDLTSTQII